MRGKCTQSNRNKKNVCLGSCFRSLAARGILCRIETFSDAFPSCLKSLQKVLSTHIQSLPTLHIELSLLVLLASLFLFRLFRRKKNMKERKTASLRYFGKSRKSLTPFFRKGPLIFRAQMSEKSSDQKGLFFITTVNY